jgi:hypothetical protein
MDITQGDNSKGSVIGRSGSGFDQADPSPAVGIGRRYDQEVLLIKAKHGDLESIRAKLNLSKRKVCELLLVDPSSWSRWTTQVGEDAPPYIYRSLQWYLSLIDKDVSWHPMNSFMGLLPKKGESMQLQKLKEELQLVKSSLKDKPTINSEPFLNANLSDELTGLRKMIEKQQDLSSSWKLLVLLNLVAIGLLVFFR